MGGDVAGFALVVWHNEEYSRSYEVDRGPTRTQLVPTWAADAHNQHWVFGGNVTIRVASIGNVTDDVWVE
jgi:hypothetical protein